MQRLAPRLDELTAGDQADPARQFKQGHRYVSVGVAIYPYVLWLWRKK